MLKLLTSLFLLSCFSFSVAAQSAHDEALLAMTQNCKARSEADIKALAECLVNQASTAEDSVRLLAYWLTQNIKYNIRGLESGRLDRSADALKSKSGVCEDYAWLFQQMCLAVGIECHFVPGFIKRKGYRPKKTFGNPSHAWNVVKIGDEYAFVDVTWASGYVDRQGKNPRYFKRFNPSLILATDAEFSQYHLPTNPIWQLRETPMTIEEFAELSLKNDTVATIDYKTEIAAFAQLDEYGKKAEDAKRAYEFRPTTFSYERMMRNYLNAGFGLSKDTTTKEQLTRALTYLEEVKRMAEQTTAFKKPRADYGDKATTGISYVKQKLSRIK